MTLDIALVFTLLLLALLLFVSGRMRVDLVGLLVLCALALSGLVSPSQAVSGFSNPAVIAMWAMFIMSEGLTRVGIADKLSQQLLRYGGNGEASMICALMLCAGTLSAVMNNVGVVALLLPVAVRIARQAGIAVPRLLLPLSYATLMGGLVTLIGTPPNLLASSALSEAGLKGFAFFDFATLGIPILLLGTAFVVLLGRHLLPRDDGTHALQSQRNLRAQYGLQERIFALRIPSGSLLHGRSLDDSGLTSVAGLVIIALVRRGRTQALPHREDRLEAGDILLAQGRFEHFQRLRSWSTLTIEREAPLLHESLLDRSQLLEARVAPEAALLGDRLRHHRIRERFGVNLLALRREDTIHHTRLANQTLEAGDRLLLQGSAEAMESLEKSKEFSDLKPMSVAQVKAEYQLNESLFVLRVPEDSPLVSTSLGENRLGDAFDFRLMGLFRQGELQSQLNSEMQIEAGDLLLIQGRESDLDLLRGFQQLERLDDASPYLQVFDRGQLELVEATPHPHCKLVGKRLDEIALDKRFQVEVAAIWRGGRPYRSGLKSMVLQPGDGLLIVGPRGQLAQLNRQEDLIILNPVRVDPVDSRKAPLAAGLLLLAILPVILGLLPIHLAAVAGATAMVLTGCLNMEQAQRAIDWRSIFLIAGMLPLGTAMQSSGAADWVASQILPLLAPYGPWSVIAGLYLLTALATLVIPAVALVLIMAPIAITLSNTLGISPQPAMLAVAIAATSLASPVSHPANTLVMGPGGYRFTDYLKLGLPLSLLIFALTAVLLPWLWPL